MSSEGESVPRSPAAGPSLPSARRCLARALRRCLARPVGTAGLVGWGVLLVAGCLLPRVGFLFVLAALPAGFGGLWHLALAIEGAASPDPREPASVWRHLRAGFAEYERFLSLFWIGYLITIASCGPILLALWLDRHITPEAARMGLFAGAGSLSLAILGMVLHPYLFAFFVAAEAPRGWRVQQVLESARDLMAGRLRGILPRVAVILGAGLSGLAPLVWGVSVSGWWILGVAFPLSLALVALAHLYRGVAGPAVRFRSDIPPGK